MRWDLDDSILNLKKHIETLTDVPVALQKLMFKGLIKNESDTLRKVGIKEGAKLMMIGSTIKEVIDVNIAPDPAKIQEEQAKPREPLCDQPKHKKIIDKGPPDSAIKGFKDKHEPLPKYPLAGILNNRGMSVRLTFKEWTQELWISSSASTQKIPYKSIRSVTSEPIKGHEEYHIVTLQLGPTASYYLYFVPAQFTKDINNSIMGFD
eukprot:TRINITY_DN8828_c0_g1_i1.p1 TRINITY_DN8828_c0_g1~~TRINITY_DN8828_c0_g1_i1.p1  ORF type:complete len:214 (+),score=36.05 TRINITY_DN8828_c0_g1_i1:23-643(+)